MKIIFAIIRVSFLGPFIYLLYFVTLRDHTGLVKEDVYNVIINSCLASLILIVVNLMIVLYASFQYLNKRGYSEHLLRKKIKNKIHAWFLMIFSSLMILACIIAISIYKPEYY